MIETLLVQLAIITVGNMMFVRRKWWWACLLCRCSDGSMLHIPIRDNSPGRIEILEFIIVDGSTRVRKTAV